MTTLEVTVEARGDVGLKQGHAGASLDKIQPIGCRLRAVNATDEDRADALFHALADRTRRDILRRVMADEHSVSALAASYDMSFAAVQKHVAVLERASLLTKRRNGREQLASGDVAAVRSVASLLAELEQVWRGRIARIDELITSDTPDQEV